jgi:hypothetical protein
MEDWSEEQLWQVKLDSLRKSFSGRNEFFGNVFSSEKAFKGKSTVGRQDSLKLIGRKCFHFSCSIIGYLIAYKNHSSQKLHTKKLYQNEVQIIVS